MTTDPIKWLQEARKLDGALLADMGVRVVDHPALGTALAFPYRRNGEPYAAKFRTVDKRFRSSEGVSRGLYNADALSANSDAPIVITEGEIDCLSVCQAGFERVVSLPDGWTKEGNKTDALLAAEKAFRASPYVIVAGDNDEAGESLPRAVANILRGHQVRVAAWPEGCKDANDVLMLLGEGGLSACLNAAKVIDPKGGFITGISDLPPLSRRRVLRTGIRAVDWRVAFELGAISVGTGMPGSGKSTFITWVADHISWHETVRIGLLGFETHAHRTRDHLCRLATGMPFDDLSREEQDRFAYEADMRWKLVHRTYDDGAHALGWLQEMIYTLAIRDRCKLIIVDPWNELEHLPEPGESMTSYINFALQQIRVLAEKLEIHICVIAHPRKMPTDGRPRPPTGYDIADSAAFANKPSLGFTVHQDQTDEGESIVKLVTWKVRDTQLYGFEKGISNLDFDPVKMVYRERPRETRKAS